MMRKPIDPPKGNLGDIIISLSESDGRLVSPRCSVFFNDGKYGYRQIGLIQNLSIKASADKVPVTMEITFPEVTSPRLKKVIDKASKLCEKFGVKVKP